MSAARVRLRSTGTIQAGAGVALVMREHVRVEAQLRTGVRRPPTSRVGSELRCASKQVLSRPSDVVA